MQKLPEVEEARALMNQAKDWSVWHWLLEKKRVRIIADKAVDAFGEAEKKVKATWDDDMKKAYRELEAQASFESNPRAKQRYEKAKGEAKDVDPKIKLGVEKVKEADDVAYKARMDAEDLFAEAERRLSASLSRQGAEKAPRIL